MYNLHLEQKTIDNLFSSSLPGPGLVEVAQDDPDVLLLVLEGLQLGGQLVIETLRENNLKLPASELPDQVIVRLNLYFLKNYLEF